MIPAQGDDRFINELREEIIGHDFTFKTPFGEKLMLYADYTASGRSVRFIENYLLKIQESYANTHTEDDVTGRSTTQMLHEAESTIKECVGATSEYCVVATGTGSTGAIHRLQQILGTYIPPATLARLKEAFESEDQWDSTIAPAWSKRPVVFVGPFEHHSNEITWRECFAEVVTIRLSKEGNIDLLHLKQELARSKFDGRLKIGSFSACSNVTGRIAPVDQLSKMMHSAGGIICIDYAASGPYVKIDLKKDDLDAIFLSPHKFLGGPGSSGILVFNERLYRRDLPPTCGAGGTVDYVSPTDHDYINDIEEREKPGTPGPLQMMKAALAMDLKRKVGEFAIHRREKAHLELALGRMKSHPGIEILGNASPDNQIGIISFNIKDEDQYLHPKLATRLLNDLFGIQSRAGCSCAGPYGHHLLGIDHETSEKYRAEIKEGYSGVKPGWIRVGFHYTMTKEEVAYICDAIEFLAEEGSAFLAHYQLDIHSGAWSHPDDNELKMVPFGLDAARAVDNKTLCARSATDRKKYFSQSLKQAKETAGKTKKIECCSLPKKLERLAFFRICRFR